MLPSSLKAKLSPVLPMRPQALMTPRPTVNGVGAPSGPSSDGTETIRVTDMTSSALFPKSFGSIFNSINKSVSTAFSNLISTTGGGGGGADPGHAEPLPPGAGAPFQSRVVDPGGGGLLARFQSLSPIAGRGELVPPAAYRGGAAAAPPPPASAAAPPEPTLTQQPVSSMTTGLTPQVPLPPPPPQHVRSYPPSPLPQPWTPRPQVNHSTPAIGVTVPGAFDKFAPQPNSAAFGERKIINNYYFTIIFRTRLEAYLFSNAGFS